MRALTACQGQRDTLSNIFTSAVWVSFNRLLNCHLVYCLFASFIFLSFVWKFRKFPLPQKLFAASNYYYWRSYLNTQFFFRLFSFRVSFYSWSLSGFGSSLFKARCIMHCIVGGTNPCSSCWTVGRSWRVEHVQLFRLCLMPPVLI